MFQRKPEKKELHPIENSTSNLKPNFLYLIYCWIVKFFRLMESTLSLRRSTKDKPLSNRELQKLYHQEAFDHISKGLDLDLVR